MVKVYRRGDPCGLPTKSQQNCRDLVLTAARAVTTNYSKVSFFQLIEPFDLLCALVAVENIFSPLVVDFYEALELFVL